VTLASKILSLDVEGVLQQYKKYVKPAYEEIVRPHRSTFAFCTVLSMSLLSVPFATLLKQKFEITAPVNVLARKSNQCPALRNL
jgi:uridine kinase